MNLIQRVVLLSAIVLLRFAPAHAQLQRCLQIWKPWSDVKRHQVNLDTGNVTTYDSPYLGGSTSLYWHSPDFRYRYTIEPNQNRSSNLLTLIDIRDGSSVLLSESLRGRVYWSGDSQWLAYAERDAAPLLKLTLYHVVTANSVSTELAIGSHPFLLDLIWSADTRQIALSLEVTPGLTTQVRVYSVPQLALVQQHEVPWSATTLLWSAYGRYLAVGAVSQDIGIIDTQTRQLHEVQSKLPSGVRLQWSLLETYLVASSSHSHSFDTYVFIDPLGNVVLDNLNAVSSPTWVNGHEFLGLLWRDTGIPELVLMNLETKAQRLRLPATSQYALSADSRYLAVRPFNVSGTDDAQILDFFDLTEPAGSPVLRLTLDAEARNFTWDVDGLELAVLFADRTLSGYDYASGQWRKIAVIPGDESYMEHIACR